MPDEGNRSMEKIYEPVKESREGYYVKYYPITQRGRLAYLQLVFVIDIDKNDAIKLMEKELMAWLVKYPIPLMVSAFDNKGDSINLNPIKPLNILTGFFDNDKNIRMYWESFNKDEIPDIVTNQEYIDKIYSNVPFKTSAELDDETQKKRKKIKFGWLIIFIWLVPFAILFAILENYNNWISLIAMIFSIYLAIRKGLELTGKWPKSKRAKDKEKEEQLKSHYYYHCQLNPEGFAKLRNENFEKMAMDRIAQEAKSLQIK